MPTQRDPFQLETAEGFPVIGTTPSSKAHDARNNQQPQKSKKKADIQRKGKRS